MNLQNSYYFYEKAIPNRLCDIIIKEAETRQEHKAGVSKSKDITQQEIDKVRDSFVVWFNDPWLYNLVIPFVRNANQEAGWNFDIDWNENIQFTKYKLN